ncbi:hypothetical protein [Halocynthiibacter styelae]|uniref:Uncharacterized protein n=1 Tax=Halocynthiibacter styelae TaxID=2761955 RepID=A0A8J7ILQ1_9RHOB|nr:hypothetical protein [Paenihalocynthiibacter styelae]MBI1492721.1 hypothetical protein [Paenihalocynthiibacter styelae]
MRGILQTIACVLLCVAVMAPRVNAAIVAFFPDSFRMIVICTGTEMRTIILDPSGAPVSEELLAESVCLMGDGAVMSEAPEVFWQRLHLRFTRDTALFAQFTDADQLILLRPPGRGPPALFV